MSHGAVNVGREKLPVMIHASSGHASRAVALEMANLIRERAAKGQRAVLGLATGSTPHGVYEELVRLHKVEGLSFRNVTSFNLDEYYPMQPNDLQSYRRFMREYLFDRVDIDPAHAHVPDGTVSRDKRAGQPRRCGSGVLAGWRREARVLGAATPASSSVCWMRMDVMSA